MAEESLEGVLLGLMTGVRSSRWTRRVWGFHEGRMHLSQGEAEEVYPKSPRLPSCPQVFAASKD